MDSDLPILRYIFVHHVRNFPFLDQAREKEFWQDKLQVVSGLELLTGRTQHADAIRFDGSFSSRLQISISHRLKIV